jgi:DNA polymerase III epsilon subunit family exonuclease
MRDLIFDTETTGLLKPNVTDLKDQPKIIEFGLVVVEDGKIIGAHNWLINPGELITAEITKITGITNEMLEGKPEFRQVLGEIEEVFAGADRLICHNAPFDTGMLKNELERCGRTGFPWPAETICTVQEYRHEFGGRYPKLTALYERKVGKPLEQTHRATDDCEALYDCLVADGFFELKI